MLFITKVRNTHQLVKWSIRVVKVSICYIDSGSSYYCGNAILYVNFEYFTDGVNAVFFCVR